MIIEIDWWKEIEKIMSRWRKVYEHRNIGPKFKYDSCVLMMEWIVYDMWMISWVNWCKENEKSVG